MSASVFLVLSFFIQCFYVQSLFSIVKGSNTAVSIEANYSFPAAGVDNEIRGFGWFKNGFSLEDATTTCSFTSVYPVSGTVDLSGGTLYLHQDLFFQNMTDLQGLGTIIGNSYIFDLCSSITFLPTNTRVFDNTFVSCALDTSINSPITFKGTSFLRGNQNTVILSSSGQIIVDSGSTLELSHMKLMGLANDNLRCVDDTAKIILDDVELILDQDFTFSYGSMKFIGEVDLLGSYSFNYESSQTSSILSRSFLHIDDGVKFSIGRKRATDYVEPLYFTDASSDLILGNCNWIITGSGMGLTNGRVLFTGQVIVDIESTTTNNGVMVGNNTAAGDFEINFGLGAQVTFNSGHFIYNNTVGTKVVTESKNMRLVRGQNSNIYLAQSALFPAMTLELLSNLTPPIQIAEGKTLSYSDLFVVLPSTSFHVTSHRYDQSTFFLDGNDELFLAKGDFPLNVRVANTGNIIHGNGTIGGLITLVDAASELTCDFYGSIGKSIPMNNGKIILMGDLALGADVVLSGSGTMNLSSHTLSLGQKDLTWTSSIQFECANATLELKSKLSLLGTMTFNGTCAIKGNGNTINFADIGSIVVDDGSTLILQDIRLEGVSGKVVRCLADDSLIVLDNVQWLQSGDYIFDTGRFKFMNNVSCCAPHQFFYDSSQTSTIAAYSTWHISDGMELKIGRKKATDYVEPLAFADASSLFSLDSCSWTVTSSGIGFTKGKVCFNRDVTVDIQSTTTSNGVVVGDNSVLANDCLIYYNAGSHVKLNSGHFTYNNVSPTRTISSSRSARLTRQAASNVHLATSATFPAMTLELASNLVPPIQIADGAILQYNDTYIVLPGVAFDITSNRYDQLTFFLDGSDELFLAKGDFPLNIRVSNTGNQIHGNGNISGTITLVDSATEVMCDFYGSVEKTVNMNNGKIILRGDLDFGADVILSGSGVVDLAAYTLSLGQKDLVWTSSIQFEGTSATLELRSNLSLLGTMTFKGTCELKGNGNTLNFNDVGSIVVDSGSTLILNDILLEGISGNVLRCLTDDSSIVLDNVQWVQTGNYTFDVGRFAFVDNVLCRAPHTFWYDSSQTSTILSHSSLCIADGLEFKIGRKKATNSVEPLVFSDVSSQLILDGCSWTITSSGMTLTKGKVIFAGEVLVDIESTTTNNGIMAGDGTVSGDLAIHYNAGSFVKLNSGHFVYNNVSPTMTTSSSQTGRLTRYLSSNVYLAKSVTFPAMTLELKSNYVPQIQIASGVTLSYDDTFIILPDAAFDVSCTKYDLFTFYLGGNDELFIAKGKFLLNINIDGVGNQIRGNGNVAGTIVYTDSAAQLSCDLNGLIEKSPLMNGGTLILSGDLALGSAVMLSGAGTTDLSTHKLSLGPKELNWTTDMYWDGNQATLELNANVALSSTWTFSGICTISGNGNSIDLGSSGALLVERASSLRFRNITLENISATKIACLDDAATIILDNVRWMQDGAYSFTTGAMQFKNSVVMLGAQGGSVFAYQTSQTSTIFEKTYMVLDQNTTFSYDPIGSLSKDLLEFVDQSSHLVLKGATLHTTLNGMRLRKGTLKIKEQSYFSSEVESTDEATITDEGITLGDGTALNDCACEIVGGALLSLTNGSLYYNNVTSTSMIMKNRDSTLSIASNAKLSLNQTLDIGLGRLNLSETALLEIVSGKDIVGSIFMINV